MAKQSSRILWLQALIWMLMLTGCGVDGPLTLPNQPASDRVEKSSHGT